jgi:hypothetical protein
VAEITPGEPPGRYIGYSPRVDVPTQRYAIMVCAAHFALHGADVAAKYEVGAVLDVDRHSRAEREAHCLAMEVLAPLEKVAKCYGDARLFPADSEEREAFDSLTDVVASRFNLPPTLIERRARELALMHGTDWCLTPKVGPRFTVVPGGKRG